MGELSALLAEYHSVSHALGEPGADQDNCLSACIRCRRNSNRVQAWSFEAQAERVIQRFSLDADALVGTLSGGQKKRLALAQALAISPELLLLDEPTNHLDVGAIEWLEEMLVSLGGDAGVHHPRPPLSRTRGDPHRRTRPRQPAFLSGQLQRVSGPQGGDAARRGAEQRPFDKFLAQEEVWIRQGIKARRTRNEGRVLRLERLRRERAARRERQGKVELAVDAGDKSGKLVASLEHVSKCFGDKVVVRDFSCRLQRGDKIGIIGANGAGKTTLLRLILGELAPDKGRVALGTKVEVAYFDQFRSQLDEQATLIDVISPGSDFVEIGNQRKHVISYLGDFLFAPQRARSLVSSLSGGERNRLLLARLFARPANVLVLDEPTNDLDIETLELLEELLQDYTGTLFLVSHDRAFIDNVVTQTIAAEGDGCWREYAGGYQDWADYQASSAQVTKRAGERRQARRPRPAEPAKPGRQKATAGGKLSWKETHELAELPQRISALEAEQKAIAERLADPALYQSQPQEAQRLAARLSEIDDQLLLLLERWEALES
jgi:ATP-binding cassette subfamily F protein uup